MIAMQRRESVPDPGRQPRARLPIRRGLLLAALREAGRPLTVEEAARAIGTAASTARFHLSLLVSAGEAQRAAVRTGSAGRPSWQYAVPPRRSASATNGVGPYHAGPYQELARVLATQLEGEAGATTAAREAGRRWADALSPAERQPLKTSDAAIDALADAFDRLGFAPTHRSSARRPGKPDFNPGTRRRRDRPHEIILGACPFEAVAREHRTVVCAVHLGLAEQTAAAIGGGITIERLEPFRSEQPLTCAVRVGVAAPDKPRPA